MWANAQPDGRPAEHRWRPLFITTQDTTTAVNTYHIDREKCHLLRGTISKPTRTSRSSDSLLMQRPHPQHFHQICLDLLTEARQYAVQLLHMQQLH